jgi:L-alanine-DL-glutamate epimerase-like enolase superfamily enzyme
MLSKAPLIEKLSVSSFVIPTTRPEADGTIEWDKTTLVLVEVEASGLVGLGITYASRATAEVIHETLLKEVVGRSAFDIPLIWQKMIRATRNLGRPGAASMAISAVDLALWDLKAKILGVPLASLLGQCRESVEVYGSGGFTSYSIETLQQQLSGWADQGIRKVKMKVGAHPKDDIERVRLAREAIGTDCELFVDANGAYSCKQALSLAERFENFDVRWFEEPVSSDNLEDLSFLREHAPHSMDIAAGEYGYDPVNLRRMLESKAVDVLQIDATRCLGLSGFLQAAAISRAHFTDVSAHCAPSMHAHLGCSVFHFRHLEYFFDHARIEEMFFDGALKPVGGKLVPDLSRPGFGLELKKVDIARFAA